MANKNLTDLTARTATADSDLLHINSGGTDYKEAKSDFVSDLAQEITFSNSSTLTSQADSIASSKGAGLYYGTISSFGHQSETGMPTNDNFLITLEVRAATVMRLTAKRASGISAYENQKSTSWSGWIEMPTRAEITSLNNSLTNSLNYFQSTGHNPGMVYDLNGAYTGMTSNTFLSIVQYYAESTSSAHSPATGNGICITFRASASYGVQLVLCNVGVYVRYINNTFGNWKQINYYT